MGGTFNPIHVGHLVAAEEARERYRLDRVDFVPAGVHPHGKEIPGGATAGHRLRMTGIATADNPAFGVSRFEVDGGGTSYSVDTVRHYRDENPAADIYFITGADAALELPTWKEPGELLALATVVAAIRPGYTLERLEEVAGSLGRSGRIEAMEMPLIGISSSLIRERVAAGKSIRYLVPGGVERFIEEEELYRQK